jgi:hypothetical protein
MNTDEKNVVYTFEGKGLYTPQTAFLENDFLGQALVMAQMDFSKPKKKQQITAAAEEEPCLSLR